ncbi:imelysin family protein [Pseudotabrizicola sp. 4114]|uniref:imelysin family protein n=1 Tax=Pseudotabrizicola sp. 4114 TaxID=2817731 RepID=UPI00285C3389|nr:putative lipoprotein [Pseudorhodobacter sp. 4114]
MLKRLTLMLALLTSPVHADVADVVADHILPGYAAFAQATADLDLQAAASCDPDTLRPAFQTAFDAWMAVQHLHLGPVEEAGRGLAIVFWPDPKGLGRKAQLALVQGDPAKLTPEAFADQSVAARGLTGLERLLYPTGPWPADTCPLIRATAADLARLAAEVQGGWTSGFADQLLTAGAPGNTRYLSEAEARQALFTVLVTGLAQLHDQRLGRPMGTFDRPTPERAEAVASGRSLRNVRLSLQALRALTESLTEAAPLTQAALDHAVTLTETLNDPVFAGTATPSGRLKVEVLQQAVEQARLAVLAEIGPALGVGLGFNALDGD